MVLADNILVKRIKQQVREGAETITLYSDNAAYAPMEVAREDVRELWQVKMFLSGNIPANSQQLQARLRELLESIGPNSDVLREYAAEQAGGGAITAVSRGAPSHAPHSFFVFTQFLFSPEGQVVSEA